MTASNPSNLRQAFKILGLALLYFIAAKWGLLMAIVQSNATAIWPPTGIALAALLVGGRRLWPGIFLGAFAANLSTAGTIWTSLGIGAGNTLEALVGSTLVIHFAGGREALLKSANLFKFAFLGGLMAPLVSATVGVGTLALAGMTGPASFRAVWMTWWLGDIGGALLFAPPILLWPQGWNWKVNARRFLEGAFLTMFLLLAAWVLYGGKTLLSTENANAEFLFLPLFLWVAIRFGPFPSCLAVMFISLASIRGTLIGLGPFHAATLNQSLLLLQSFMGVTSLTILALASGIAERKQAEEGLRTSQSDLQLRVLERTEELTRINRELKKKSYEMENSEKYFRALIENALDIVTILDGRGTILFESPSIKRVLGYGSTELNGMNTFSLVHPEDLPRVQEAFGGVLEGPGNIRSVKFRFRHKDGSWRNLESIGTNLISDEAIQGVVVNSRDITLEEEAQRALAEREERLRLLVETVQDYAIILLNPEGRVESWNVGAQRIEGYEAREIIGKHFSYFYPPEVVKEGKPEKLLDQAVQMGRVEDEGWRVRKDGSRFWADTILTVLKDNKGQLMGFAKITRDMTQRKQMEELARSNQELEQFAYVASHDLQEPLRMVTSYVQLLAHKYGNKLDREADSYIQQAVDGAKRMQALINDLLAYSRVGNQRRSFDRVDFEEVLAGALRNLETTLKETGARVTHGLLPTVVGDFPQFLQLLQNLIGNSLKFRGKNVPAVHVDVVRKGEEWVFSVRDNGIGIDPKYSERIFEVFKRLHTRSEYPGTGIGLAICRKVVTQYGGRIWIESKEGEGATVYWTLPVPKGASLESRSV